MKIFLYFEENDFMRKMFKEKKTNFLIENSKINHKRKFFYKNIFKTRLKLTEIGI